MPLFTYIARDANGKAARGSIEALSAQAARDALKSMNVEAEELYEVPEHLRDPEPLPMAAPAAASWSVTPEASAPPPAHEIPHEQIVADHIALKKKQAEERAAKYYPLVDTLRLYAGWLLSWYFLIFAFGSYAYLRSLPVSIPLVADLFQSPVIISFAFGAFLFLLLSELHRLLGRGKILGTLLVLAWFAVFIVFRMNQ